MKCRISLVLVVLLVLPLPVEAQERKLPNIVILATGGTIAGAAPSGTQSA
jgi:L-asparaginase